MTLGQRAAGLGTLALLALVSLAATGEPRMDQLPVAVWVAVVGVLGIVITQAVNVWVARVNRKPTPIDQAKQDATLGDGIRQDAVYWQGRAHDGDAENERLRALLRESHLREERLLRVNDTVMVSAAQTRNEVSRAIGSGDAATSQG